MRQAYSHVVLRLFPLITAGLILLVSGAAPGASAQSVSPQSSDANLVTSMLAELTPELSEALERYGDIPIIITLNVPGYPLPASGEELLAAELPILSAANMDALAEEIAAVRDGLLERLAILEGRGGEGAPRFSQIKTYDYFPLLAMITDAAALNALAEDAAVVQISLDIPVPSLMDDTIPLIGADNNHYLGYTGSGWSVAILDTGVDKLHPALLGKVISEACYSSNVPSQGSTSFCPNGATSSTASNSALPCPFTISSCDHGTHVAGIAARVAPGARLIPIQVFSRFTDSGSNTYCVDANRTSPCTLSYTSDQVAALNRVWALHISSNNINVAAANMSLGSGNHAGPCDHVITYNPLRIAINQLRDQNVATVIAAGNSGYRNAMAAPACLTPAISVANSTKSNQVSNTSNISVYTTLIAPGASILAPVPTNLTPIYKVKGGTSMAAPHVAGAIATLKEAKPNATVPQIITALTGSGTNITDQRSGGFVTKRRLSAWNALCTFINCDADDFRTIGANQTLNGSISPAGDVDHYYFFGTAGQRLTLRMNRFGSTLDPYLELFSPQGYRVAFNDNGGGGVNALINGYLLPSNGMYQIRVRSVNNFTGFYEIISSTQNEPLNPVPAISHLSPSSATGSFFGSDFWVAIYGQNFMPESQVRINGSLRAKYYSSSTLIYIRVLGSDIGWPWPRNTFITVQNPAPGGGTSSARALTIRDPFLGESRMLYPEDGTSVSVGIEQTFAISWTAPITTGTWRDMQYMDMRLSNEAGETAAWVRIVEQPGTGSYFRLLNAAEELIDEGLPGEMRDLVLTDTVTLHLADSSFFGSGLVAIMTPTLTFGPAAVGTYNVEFRVDSNSQEEGENNVQDGDMLGRFTILPEGCQVAIADLTLTGESTGTVGELLIFTTAYAPLDASIPLTYTWSPEPGTGQGFPNAAYQFDEAGEYIISAQVANCGAFAGAAQTLQISTGPDPDLDVSLSGPPFAAAGMPFTYTLTVRNDGATEAENLSVQVTLPAGATYVAGGIVNGDDVEWLVPALAGYGTTTSLTFTVHAASDLPDTTFSAVADGGWDADGTGGAVQVVNALVALTPVTTGTISTGSWGATIPAGSVFEDWVVTYAAAAPPDPWPGDLSETPYAGVSFQLGGHPINQPDPAPVSRSYQVAGQLYETAQVYLNYDPASLGGLAPGALTLHYWDGTSWSGEGVGCTTDQAQQLVSCTVENPLLTRYVLVEELSKIYLPLIMRNSMSLERYALITGIQLNGIQYSVNFFVHGFVPDMHGYHVHFFFDTVPPDEAGLPGSGPWYVYAGGSPFTGYGLVDRPPGATQMCILVANHDHSIIPGTGNCYNLP